MKSPGWPQANRVIFTKPKQCRMSVYLDHHATQPLKNWCRDPCCYTCESNSVIHPAVVNGAGRPELQSIMVFARRGKETDNVAINGTAIRLSTAVIAISEAVQHAVAEAKAGYNRFNV